MGSLPHGLEPEMELAGSLAGLENLPQEILLHILSFLDPSDIARLQQVSHHLWDVGRDNNFWKLRCYEESSFLETLDRRRRLFSAEDERRSSEALRRAAVSFRDDPDAAPSVVKERELAERRRRERARLVANWDPSHASEKTIWYDEYIQRHAPIVVNWFQQPHIRDGSLKDVTEARGVALYRPDNPDALDRSETLLAVSPLDDGSVCLWDVNGALGKRGAVVAKSNPGILFIDGPSADNNKRSKRIDSGVTECVSVDSRLHRAYFAVQSHLIEVDLQRLSVVGCESYPWSITALSPAHPALPLTVGTSLGIHMYDSREKSLVLAQDADGVDIYGRLGAKEFYEKGLRDLFDDEPLPPYAPLSQPGPLSILHLPRPGAGEDLSDDIYVAGRFSNILHYDRRMFPSIKGSIHSGARLCGMTSLPYPFSALDSELRRKGQLSLDQVRKSKAATGGRTLIACGEYNTKGSLEMYGLCSESEASTSAAGGLQNSTMKNRQTSSQSKLLSVANHGTRLVFSDGSGLLKWFERDGFTEVRRSRVGHCEREPTTSIFASMPGSDDIARKLLPTGQGGDAARINDNDLLFWTGEKLGLVGFSSRPGFTADDFEEKANAANERELEREERIYSDRMRKALERQADDVRFVRNLGLGSGTRQ